MYGYICGFPVMGCKNSVRNWRPMFGANTDSPDVASRMGCPANKKCRVACQKSSPRLLWPKIIMRGEYTRVLRNSSSGCIFTGVVHSCTENQGVLMSLRVFLVRGSRIANVGKKVLENCTFSQNVPR